MSPLKRYCCLDDLPKRLAVFPLWEALLLPRGQLPLNIFEPRYLAMIDAALAGNRLIGMVQPARGERKEDRPSLAPVGTVGRITSYAETNDGRYMITLSGIARFRIIGEEETDQPFRICRVDYAPFVSDLKAGHGEDLVDRKRLLDMFRAYLDCHDLQADWDSIDAATTESLVNALCMLSPYGRDEKQALLEASDLNTRAEILIALTEKELQQANDEPGPTLQ